MIGLFVTKFESKANSQLQNYKKKVLNFGGYSLFWCFTQFGVLLSPMALKVVGPLLLDSNSSRDDTNPPFQFPIWQLTNKETKRQTIIELKFQETSSFGTCFHTNFELKFQN